MSREEIQKLLGGYATGTLTTAEQRALFEAALEDQELFDQLAHEQALHDLLREPSARAQVVEALERPRRGWVGWTRAWWPAAAAISVACAALLVVFAVGRRRQEPVQVATYRPAEQARPAETAPPAASPVMPAPPPAPIRATPAAPKPSGDKVLREKTAAVEPAVKDERKAADDVKRDEADQKMKQAAADAPAPPAAAVSPGNVVGGLGGAAPASIQVNEQAQTVQVNNQPPQTAQALFNNAPPVQVVFQARQQAAPAPEQQQQAQGALQQSLQFRSQQFQQAYAAMVFPGVRYRILRQLGGGEYTEAAADSLKAGDTLKLEFMPNVSGKLEVRAGVRTLVAQDVAAGGRYATEPLEPGTAELAVDFIPQGLPRVAVKRAAASAQAVNVVERKPDETYVVGVPPTDRVRFKIQLRYH